ncbi:tripartite tricarboxylate transporter permease [Chloroflexota bacterium]
MERKNIYLETALQALMTLLQPAYLIWLLAGVVLGVCIGVLPGLGGIVAMSLVLPFIFGQDPKAALALLVGAGATTVTGDTITCVLFGIPGTVGSMATVIDGYPMARKGQAAPALGGAFLASMIGGVFGAICIFVALPIAKPLVLSLASPEFFMLTLLGIIMVGMLAGRQPIKGILSAGVGMMLAAIGGARFTGVFRYTMGWSYLFDSVPLVVLALGIFAIPEVINMLVRGTQIATEASDAGGMKGMLEGMKSVRRNIGLVLRCSAIGAYLGFIPGLGTAVSQWVAYGHAIQSSKDKTMFGKGDIRGVIGPEATNNATIAGALIPTMFFGIPGSGMMALVLAAFLILDIPPGRPMFTTRLDVTLSVIWSIALANVFGMALCLLLVRPLAYLTKIRIYYLAPFILMIVVLGAFQATRHWGDLIMLLALGLLGWCMSRFGWERPPLVVGFVLGGLAERYLYLSIMGYDGIAWMIRPGVIIITLLILGSVYMGAKIRTPRPPKPVLAEEEEL